MVTKELSYLSKKVTKQELTGFENDKGYIGRKGYVTIRNVKEQ